MKTNLKVELGTAVNQKARRESSSDGRLEVSCPLETQKSLKIDTDDPSQANDDRGTSLLTAASKGDLELCKYLIEKGADSKRATDNGNTPLLAAASKGHLEVD